MKRSALSALALALLLAAVAPASAAMSQVFALDETMIGPAASGIGKITSVRGHETFELRVFADVKDETTFMVLIQRTGQTPGAADSLIAVGKIQMKLGSGILVLDTDTDVSPAFPVRGIERVLVQYKGRTILEGVIANTGTAG